MDFISNSEEQVKAMLAVVGAESIDELFSAVPKHLRLAAPRFDDGLSESEGMRLMEGIAAKNTFPHMANYLGAGAYEHHVPALVGAICSKSEFLTSYTPYQAEASQGMLQVIFEFQSAICALMGLDVANASQYDGSTACAEGVLMALRLNKDRKKVLLAASLHPHYNAVVEQYLKGHSIEIEWLPYSKDGSLDIQASLGLIDDQTAAVVLQYPNFFGVIDDIAVVASKAKACGALTLLSANPLVYALYASAGELGVDIATGDAQPLGLPMHFGGPYVGYIACRSDLVRQMPGRIVGETVDNQGRRGFVLTLQAREQHIRREKATSNICTNQALAALASLVAMMWYGKEGLKRLALTNFQRAAYLRKSLSGFPQVVVKGDVPIFNEFAVSFGRPIEKVFAYFRSHGIEPGVDLGGFFPDWRDYLLVAVTEMKDKAQLDRYVEVAQSFLRVS